MPHYSSDHPPRLVTIPEAGRLLSVSRSTIYKLIKKRLLVRKKIGRSARITIRSILKLTLKGTS